MQRAAVLYIIVVLLVFIVATFQFCRLKDPFIASEESPRQEGYVDKDDKAISDGRTFHSDDDTIVYVHKYGDKLQRSSEQSLIENSTFNSKEVAIVFGHGDVVKSYFNIIEAPWVSKLQDLLKAVPHPIMKRINLGMHSYSPSRSQVTVVVSSSNYTLSLINWLVSASIITNPPLENIIVISLDHALQTLLKGKGLMSLYVDPMSVINGHMRTVSSHIWITRCVIYRLLNHWGYDVIAYDTDAIVLKNLQPILEHHPDSDIVASSGTYPFQLGRKWGLTVCMGVIVIRSTERTELLWNSLSHTRNDVHDDQVKLNYALDSCDIQWSDQGKNIDNQSITGKCTKDRLNALQVTVLPRNVICRRCKKYLLKGYYVWHSRTKRGGDMKMKIAISGHTWFLKNLTIMEDGSLRESEESEQLKGQQWLQSLISLIDKRTM